MYAHVTIRNLSTLRTPSYLNRINHTRMMLNSEYFMFPLNPTHSNFFTLSINTCWIWSPSLT